MTARFECQGYRPADRAVVEDPELCKVFVELETDGRVVGISALRSTSACTPVTLTPDGWLQLAGHARRLVDDANSAWAAMEAIDPAAS